MILGNTAKVKKKPEREAHRSKKRRECPEAEGLRERKTIFKDIQAR